ncbi:unnamed protein product [Haemonchus placei]|uniref:Rho-GAP domain-containing protein n=1 Tax=Haemonchus placei TaxID=6290 RepID=A0A158QLC0_HAEPC|nr:unnamed protein product [Haemonchus placei]
MSHRTRRYLVYVHLVLNHPRRQAGFHNYVLTLKRSRNAAPPSRLNRRALQQAVAATYDGGVSPYYGSGGYSSPVYSSPYSTRSYQSPPVPARNLVIQSDGYFMHDVSPDTSLSRVRPPRSESPSTSSGVPQLRVDTQAIKSESSLDNTDEEQSSGTTTMNHNRRDSGVGSSLSRSPSCSSDDAFFTDVQLARCIDSLSVLELVLRYLRQMSPDTVGIFRKNGVKSRILEVRGICDRDSDVDVFIDENRLDPGQVHDVADMLKQYLRELPEPLMTARLSETFANIFIHEHFRMLALQYAILLLPDENREALQTLLLFLSDVSKHAENNSVSSLDTFLLTIIDNRAHCIQKTSALIGGRMPAQNLAVCFTPSLFHLSASRLDKITPTRRHKTIGAAGMPTEREMRETKAAQQCLTFLIQNCRSVFVAAETSPDDRVQSDNDAPLLKELGLNGPRAYLIDKVLDLVKEHSERWKGWIFDGTHEDVEISCKIPNDCHPLKLFRVWIDVAAPPKQVMNRIMRERNVWDTSVVNWRTIDVLHVPDTDLHQYVLNDTVGHPTRDCFVVRFHRADLSEIRGACVIAERSVQCNETQLLGGISAAVLDSRFLIEPKAGHSRVTYLSRVDLRIFHALMKNGISYASVMCLSYSLEIKLLRKLYKLFIYRGRCPSWYNKVYGNIIARQMIRLRDSFQSSSESIGPETKV